MPSIIYPAQSCRDPDLYVLACQKHNFHYFKIVIVMTVFFFQFHRLEATERPMPPWMLHCEISIKAWTLFQAADILTFKFHDLNSVEEQIVLLLCSHVHRDWDDANRENIMFYWGRLSSSTWFPSKPQSFTKFEHLFACHDVCHFYFSVSGSLCSKQLFTID